MPPYDPKANRPKLVPVDDAPAPVDALLGPAPAAPEPTRPHLSVVPPDEPPPAPSVAPAAEPAGASGPDLKKVAVVAVVVAAIVGVIVVVRRRSA
jgi:hypothetical protein